MNRSCLFSSWDYPSANIDFIYCIHCLNQFSVIARFIVSSNSVAASDVLCDPTNIFLCNAISLSMSRFDCQP